MIYLAGFLLIPYGVLGSFRATELLRRARLPVADCVVMAALGVALVFAGLGLLLGSPIAIGVVVLLLLWRALGIYNARLLGGGLRLGELWKPAVPDMLLLLLVALGSL